MDQLSQEASNRIINQDDGLASTSDDILSGKSLSAYQLKPLLKTLRYLREDLYAGDSESPTPSTWVLKSVVKTARPSSYRPQHWQKDLAKVLNSVKSLIELEKDGVHQFYKEDMSGRLFPTEDGYALTDLSDFIARIENHIRAF